MRRHAALLVTALGVAALQKEASAAARLDPAFVALLAHRGARRHPFSDASGRLPVVLEVPLSADARALGFLPLSPGLATVRLSPADLPSFVAAHGDIPFSIWPGLHAVLDQSARLNRVTEYRAALAAAGSPIAGTGKGVVVGIVDIAFDATHPDLRDAGGGSRIAWMLDFSSLPQGLHADLEAMYGCTTAGQATCAVLDKAAIDRALSGDPSVTLPSDVVGHGTHVASIAAGNGGSDARFVGGAPEATLIVAPIGHGDASGAVSDVDMVTAARFIFDRAEEMGMPAVVNLSLGGDFGPHDGTTPLEVSLAQLVGPEHPGRSIVVAAGNSGALYKGDESNQVLGIHTETRITAGAPAKLKVFTPDAKKGSDVSGSVFVWVTYGATDALSIGLQGPNGMSISPVSLGHTAGFHAKDDSLTAGIYNGAVASSPLPANSHGAVLVWDGKWPGAGQVTIELEGEGFVDAWVEATFDDAILAGPVYFDLATRADTINVPASHPDLIAVGCTINRSQWVDADQLPHDLAATAFSSLSPEDGSCFFSSAGPTATGVSKPDLSAPGAMVGAAMSRDAVPGSTPFSAFAPPDGLCPAGNQCLVVDPGHALLSGTSMSSPQVAGAIALLLEKDPKLTQPEILRLLRGGVRRPKGPITADYLLGAGALDVVGSMAALDARTSAIVRAPDPAASWLSLANNYVHPGGGQPLVGTIEVRAVDGSLADGFDLARLTVDLGEEGMLDQPLSRAGPGLYSFAVSARPGAGTGLLNLDVKIDGVTIGATGSRVSGHRIVPIGADRWVASGSARVYGGCSVAGRLGRDCAGTCENSSFARGALYRAMLGLLAAITVIRRRRTRGDAIASPYPNVPPSNPQR